MKSIAALRKGGLNLKPTSLGVAHGSLRNGVIPSVAVYPLLQHTGTPAQCLVSPGDRVREGMLIGRATGAISASVHASIPGVVTACRPVRLANGEVSPAVFVKLEGEFERLGKRGAQHSGERAKGKEGLLAELKECGVVAMDAGAVPLHVQWKLPRGKHVETLIVSALNDEPLLSVEHRLAVERPQALYEGLALAIRILKPKRIVAVCEGEGPMAADPGSSVERAAVEAGVLFTRTSSGRAYPRGEPRELARSATGQLVPPGTSLMSLGVMVTNVSTLLAVRDAINDGRPLIERYVTVAGGAIADPSTLRVRVGTRIRDVIEECEGLVEVPDRIVAGGPFTGAVVYDLDTPVTKNTPAILALTKRETDGGERAPCISCGRCVTACPEALNPTRLFKSIEHGRHEEAVEGGLLECTECGSCSIVCPSHIPLLYGLREGKRRHAENRT